MRCRRFNDAVGLRPVDPGSLVLDALELQEQLVGVAILATAEFAAIVGEHSVDLGPVRLKAWQHIIVEQLDGGQRQLVGVEPGPGVPAVAVDGGLQIDLADALQDANEEGVDGNQGAGVRRLDMTIVIAGVMLPRFAVWKFPRCEPAFPGTLREGG